MKYYKKIIFCLFVITMLLTMLISCGDQDEFKKLPETSDSTIDYQDSVQENDSSDNVDNTMSDVIELPDDVFYD